MTYSSGSKLGCSQRRQLLLVMAGLAYPIKQRCTEDSHCNELTFYSSLTLFSGPFSAIICLLPMGSCHKILQGPFLAMVVRNFRNSKCILIPRKFCPNIMHCFLLLSFYVHCDQAISWLWQQPKCLSTDEWIHVLMQAVPLPSHIQLLLPGTLVFLNLKIGVVLFRCPWWLRL